MFKFEYDPNAGQPKEKKEYAPLCEGPAEFTIKTCEDKISRNGNAYLNLKIWVTDSSGTKGTIFDTLMSAKSWANKIKALVAAIGRPELYSATGELNIQALVDASGSCVLKMKEGKNGYPDEIGIESYVPQERDPNDQQARSAGDNFLDGGDVFDSEIPF